MNNKNMDIRTIVPATEARKNLFKLLEKVKQSKGEFVLTVDGKPRAVLLSIAEWESIMATLDIATDPKMVDAIDEGMKDIEEGKYYSLDEILDQEGLEVVADKSVKYKVKKKTGGRKVK